MGFMVGILVLFPVCCCLINNKAKHKSNQANHPARKIWKLCIGFYCQRLKGANPFGQVLLQFLGSPKGWVDR